MPNKEKISAIMRDRGYTQQKLANEANVMTSHVNKMINHDVDVRESTLKRICEALGCKAEDIW